MGRDMQKMGALRDPDETVLQAEVARALRPLANKVSPIQPLRDTLQEAM